MSAIAGQPVSVSAMKVPARAAGRPSRASAGLRDADCRDWRISRGRRTSAKLTNVSAVIESATVHAAPTDTFEPSIVAAIAIGLINAQPPRNSLRRENTVARIRPSSAAEVGGDASE